MAKTRVFAKGSLLVTDTGEVVIDEVLPRNRSMLQDPDSFISVEFDPSEPPPPPCAGVLPDEVDWTLFFKHVHDTHLDPHEKAEELKLKIEWRVSAARTVLWQVLVPA